MSIPRRLTAVLASGSLGWVLLALGVATPAAHADVQPPHDPATYYASAMGLSGTALATELNSIIDSNDFLPYTSGATDVWDALEVLDRDPNDASRIIDVYSGDSLVATNKCGSSCPLDGWNREHTWSQSRGSFDTDPGPGTDLFHMRPSRGNTNSSRGNLDFDETVNSGGPVPGCPAVCQRDSDSFEPREAIKGDVARGLFYMDVRYNGDADDQFGVDLRMWNQTGDSSSRLGVLSTLVAWSLADPPDDAERARNDLIDSDYQHNRNPFIDHPEWVCSIWGSELGPGSVCGTTGGNDAPATSPVTGSTAEDTATTVTLTATDADSDPLVYAIAEQPAHGSVSLAGDQATYTPAANYHGPDTFGWTVSDGTTTVPSSASITVTPVNDAPVALPRAVETTEDTVKTVGLPSSDVEGDPRTHAVATGPQHGTVTISGSVATYTPAADYHGPDSFTFTASDASTSAPATVSITVMPVEDVPVATPVGATTSEDVATVFALPGSDGDGDDLVYALSSQPGHGSVTLDGDQATYTPAADFHGTDSFGWTVSDGTATTAGSATVTVTPVNDAPSVSPTNPLSTTVGAPVSATIPTSDADGDPVAISAVTGATEGSVSFSGTTLTYTPTSAGADTLVVTVSDGQGGTATTQVGVEVAKATARLRFAARGLERGEPGVVKVKVRGVAGLAATGKVTLTLGSKKLTAKVAKGVATFRVARLPDATTLEVRARYSGDSRYAAGSANHTYVLQATLTASKPAPSGRRGLRPDLTGEWSMDGRLRPPRARTRRPMR